MTKEEVLQVDAHCKKHGVAKVVYLREIGVSSNEYYSSRRKHIGGTSVQVPTKQGKFLSVEFNRDATQEAVQNNALLVEMRMPSGTELRIQGQINVTMLKEIMIASGGRLSDV